MNSKIKLLLLCIIFIIIIGGVSIWYKISNFNDIVNNKVPLNITTSRPNSKNVTTNNTNISNIDNNDITLLDKQGNPVNLSDFNGKPIVINIWSVTCIYCIEEMEYFDNAMKKYDDVEILMITPTYGKEENKKVSREFIEKNNYSFNIYFDDENKIVEKFNAPGFPTTIFIDKKGNTVKTKIGPVDDKILDTYIEKIR